MTSSLIMESVKVLTRSLGIELQFGRLQHECGYTILVKDMPGATGFDRRAKPITPPTLVPLPPRATRLINLHIHSRAHLDHGFHPNIQTV
jgi:hypothetical protein